MNLMNPFIRKQATDLVTSVDQLLWWQINIMNFQSGKQLFHTIQKGGKKDFPFGEFALFSPFYLIKIFPLY